MTISARIRRWAFALAAALGTTTAARAADETPAAPAVAAPAIGAAGCATCNGAAPAAGCASCGRHLGGFIAAKRAPYVPSLCPGACFGYFQTRWNKWDDVCPLPYAGAGVSDAPPPAAGYVPPAPQPLPQPLPMPPKSDTKPETAPTPKKLGDGTENPRPMPSTLPTPIPPLPPKQPGSSITPAVPSIPTVNAGQPLPRSYGY
jgi:hypothetical protein